MLTWHIPTFILHMDAICGMIYHTPMFRKFSIVTIIHIWQTAPDTYIVYATDTCGRYICLYKRNNIS